MQILKNIWQKIKNSGRRTKIIGIVVILFFLFLILRGGKKPAQLTYTTAETNNIASSVSASGVLSGKTVATLHFNQAGKLNYLAVNNGDTVIKGQTIASLDSTQANATYQDALNNRRETQAAVDAEHDADKNNGSNETFAQKAARTAAEVANDNAWNTLLAAQDALSQTNLTSPISGIVVTQGNLATGQNVTPTDVIAQVVDFSSKDFDATVDESDIASVQVGQSAQITLNAYGDTTFDGKVVEIEPTTQTDTTGAVTVTVKIEVSDPRISQIYGLNGNANIITAQKQNTLTIPQDALIDDTHVYIKDANGKVEKRTITTGIKSDTDVEVLSGLNAGDKIVTNPQDVK
ncbi:MAG TPA: efflux RND transporter periplasmic adaptor subunit [Patescibacteria group bacterium]|nr:efflux RND transporter periplasmic adaptor subunit [Patescibacteria group bacterium]